MLKLNDKVTKQDLLDIGFEFNNIDICKYVENVALDKYAIIEFNFNVKDIYLVIKERPETLTDEMYTTLPNILLTMFQKGMITND
ncbi:MAG: hypothetical protein R3Y05_01530 [bacterium]